ncbi:MAG: hypothetical protein ACI30J_03300 [Paludibacteraceae bacterium]
MFLFAAGGDACAPGHSAGEMPASPVLAPPPDPLPEGAGELLEEVAPCS